MRFVVFGGGRVWEQRYLPALQSLSGPEALEVESAENVPSVLAKGLPGGVKVVFACEDPDRRLGASRPVRLDRYFSRGELGATDKVLILSPPQDHLRHLELVLGAWPGGGLYSSSAAPSGDSGQLPEIFIEKPLYLLGERERWECLLRERPELSRRAYYVDHYSYKQPIRVMSGQGREWLSRLGRLRRIAWVSLEARPFWESRAFAQGYWLEHGCHLFAMMRKLLKVDDKSAGTASGGKPQAAGAGRQGQEATIVSGGLGFVPAREHEWGAWIQEGRPPGCGAESAALLHLRARAGWRAASSTGDSPTSPSLEGVELTVMVGKGLVDRKVVHLEGEQGSCQVWFNEGRVLLRTEAGLEEYRMPAEDAYVAVVKDIVRSGPDRGDLLSLKTGIEDQEAVIALSKGLREKVAHAGSYRPGEVPAEMAAELRQLGLEQLGLAG